MLERRFEYPCPCCRGVGYYDSSHSNYEVCALCELEFETARREEQYKLTLTARSKRIAAHADNLWLYHPTPRTKMVRRADEMFYSLQTTLKKKGWEDKTIRAALTLKQLELIQLRYDVARHIVGSKDHLMWYPDAGYGFISWLHGEPPRNRGHYLLRAHLPEPPDRVHERFTPASIDPKWIIHMNPRLDDPPNTYLPSLDVSDIPPPGYPVTTAHESRIRNINGRPNDTINRYVGGLRYARLLNERADARSEHRAKTAQYGQRKPLIGSLAG